MLRRATKGIRGAENGLASRRRRRSKGRRQRNSRGDAREPREEGSEFHGGELWLWDVKRLQHNPKLKIFNLSLGFPPYFLVSLTEASTHTRDGLVVGRLFGGDGRTTVGRQSTFEGVGSGFKVTDNISPR